jgi:hypothetical protein
VVTGTVVVVGGTVVALEAASVEVEVVAGLSAA